MGSLEGYQFEDVGCNLLQINPLTSLTWTVQIQPEGSDRWVSVIMTADDLRALAEAARRIAGMDDVQHWVCRLCPAGYHCAWGDLPVRSDDHRHEWVIRPS